MDLAEADYQLAQKALEGCEDSARKIWDDCQPYLLGVLLNQLRSDTASMEKAREVVADLFADLYGARTRKAGRESQLLRLYDGKAPLRAWLLVCAKSRLKNWWRSKASRSESLDQMQSDGRDLTSTENTSHIDATDAVTVDLFAAALEGAMSSLEERRLVFIRLVYLHQIRRERIAALLDIHPSNVGRQISLGLEELRKNTLARLRELDPYLQITWEDCLEICRSHPRLLHGEKSNA